MIEGILITKKGLIEIGFVDDDFKSFLLKPKSNSLLSENREIEYGFVVRDNKIYSCKYCYSKNDYEQRRAGTGIVLVEVYSLIFQE